MESTGAVGGGCSIVESIGVSCCAGLLVGALWSSTIVSEGTTVDVPDLELVAEPFAGPLTGVAPDLSGAIGMAADSVSRVGGC